ncbi:MAG: flagellar biosynthesis protein FlgL [Marinosulfonomonas sp.]|nr:flagellar biosynthesis protein FlgL [Marinosulfonomonas sp.]
MSYVSIGDMAQTYMIRRQNSELKTTASRLGNELSTGQTSDVAKRFSGDFSAISAIETSLKSLQAYKSASDEATYFASSMQTSLGVMQDQTTAAVSGLLLTGNSASLTQIQNTASDVWQKFDAVVSALNTQVGGRSVFAGAATDGPAIASSASIIADLQIAIAGQTTAAGVEAAVDNWFNAPGGGFETTGYLGSTTPLSPFKIGLGQEANVSFTASDPIVRDTLKGLAMVALISEGALAGDIPEQTLLLRNAGDGLLSIGDKQTKMRANLGTVEAHIDTIAVQSASEVSALEIVKSELLSVDPYGAASELEAVQTQLETLYALTARMSRLSLVDFLR